MTARGDDHQDVDRSRREDRFEFHRAVGAALPHLVELVVRPVLFLVRLATVEECLARAWRV